MRRRGTTPRQRARCLLTYSPAYIPEILGSAAIACRNQADMASSKGRCPFPENVDGRVVVTLMGHSTGTSPHTVPQGDERIEGAADMTELAGWKPGVDMVHHRASLRSDLMQDADEIAKAQIRDFAPPQGFHALQVERFE